MDAAEARFTLRNDLDELGRLAEEIEAFSDAQQLSPAVVHAVNLALEEIVTNVISYAFADGASHEIGVRLAIRDGEIVAQVEDDGAPFDPLQAEDPDVTAPIDERRVGGLGVMLVKRLMDAVAYERLDGRNVLTIRKRLPAGV
jgi:serine/threonine-protein kinase RsbW